MRMRSLLRWAWLPVLAGAAAFAAHAARRPAPPVARWQALRVPPDSAWTELPVAGRVGQVDVGPDGRLWMGSAQGEIFVADSIGGDWRAALPGPDPNDTSLDFISLPTIDRVTWLGPRTAIASGYIRRGDADATDAVLRTTDGGVRWDTVSFGVDQWVYDAFLDRNGGVWMGGSSGTLVFSGDSGRTWKTVSRPFDASGRLRSIWIEDGRTGVAAALANEFRLTRDGGRTWRRLATPLDQKAYRPSDEEYNDHRFEQVALLGGRLWAIQETHLFTSPLSPVRWTEVTPGNDTLYAFTVDRETGGVYALGKTRRVYQVDADGEGSRLADAPMHDWARSLTAANGVVYAVDGELGLYRVSRGRAVYARPLTRAAARPPVRRIALAGGVTWGVTAHGVYATADGGRGWRLAGIAPLTLAGVLPLDGGRLMVWTGHGFNAVFDPRTGALDEVAALRGYDVVNVLAGDSLWVAFGGRQYESAGRVDVARTFYPGEFAGTREHGFVLVSRDRGRSWTRADEWRDHGVAWVFVHPGGAMTLLSYLGSVRRLTPARGGYRAETLVTATDRNRDSVPYVQEAGGMYFDGDEGWLDGWIHHRGNQRYVTHDGGRTWKAAELRDHHYQALFPARGGWIGNTGHRLFWIDRAGERELFNAGGREARYDAEGDYRAIRHAAAAPDGAVTVLLSSGEVKRVPLPRVP